MSRPEAPGRRMAARRARRPDRQVAAAVVLLLLAGVALLSVGPGRAGQPDRGPATGAPVTHVLLGCPRSLGAATLLQVGAVPAESLADRGVLRQGPPDGQLERVEARRGRLVSLPEPRAARKIEATGPLAAGVFGFRADQGQRTVAVTDCARPASDWWFTGAGATLDHASELVITNLDPGPAVVDVQVLGPDGEVDTVGTRGITVAPGGQHRLPLTDVAPQSDELALHVHASRGRVTAEVSDSFARRPGQRPGLEWLPSSTRASRTVRLAGLPQDADRRTLVVANPSQLEAVVQVQVAAGSGTFAPTGLDDVTLAPGTVQTVDVTDVVDPEEPVALRLRSRVPVVATVRSFSRADSAYAAPVVPLREPAVAPLPPGTHPVVVLTAGSLAGTAPVTAYDGRGNPTDRTELRLTAGATASWKPPRRSDYLVVRPAADTGPLHGAVSYSGGGLSVLALTPLRIRVLEPVVRPALR